MRKLILAAVLPVLFFATQTEAQNNEALGRVFWRGLVDDRVHLLISGSKLETKTVAGRESPEGVFSFTAPMPERAVVVAVLKKKGRSKAVRVIQQPSEANEFTAIVEIYDDGGGAKEYQLEISWR